MDAAHSGMDDGAIVVGVDAFAANFPGGCHHSVHVGCPWKQLDSELAGAPQILQNVYGSLEAFRLTCGAGYCWTRWLKESSIATLPVPSTLRVA